MNKLSRHLLDVLVCPDTRLPLREADAELVARVNQAIDRGSLRNRGGQRVEKRVDGGLVREDSAVFYCVCDSIPIMLVDESIALDQL